MKEYLRKKAVELMVVIYVITAFFTPVDTVFAHEGGSTPGERPGMDAGTPSGNEEKNEGNEENPLPALPVEAPEEETGISGDKTGDKTGDKAGAEETPLPVSVNAGEEASVSALAIGIPDESGGEEAAGEDFPGPVLLTANITLYKYGTRNEIHSRYDYSGFKIYRYNAKSDREIPFSEKNICGFREITGRVSELQMIFKASSENIEYELEELDRDSLEVISTTGRVGATTFLFDHFGLFRLHLYPLYEVGDADEEDIVYYFYSTGVDNVPPVVNARLNLKGNGHSDKNGKLRYGGGSITITAGDAHTALNEDPVMTDYPNGEWGRETLIDRAEQKIYYIGVRDIKNNITVVSVDATCIDENPPVLVEARADNDFFFNGYAAGEEAEIIAEDDTELAARYYSPDGVEWLDKGIISVTCNGSYDFYLRDIFKNTAKRTLEVENIDREPPLAHFSDEADPEVRGYTSKHTLKISARDERAGLGDKPFSYDGGKTWVANDSLSVKDNGICELCVRDGLGNSTGSVKFEVKNIDNTPPETLSVSEDRKQRAGKYAAYSLVGISASDSESGLTGAFVSFDDGKTWTGETVKRVDENGPVKIRVRDGVGNVSSASINIGDLDREAPECEITGNPTNLTKNKAVLKLRLTDRLSGLKSLKVENTKAGIRKEIKAYDPDGEGTGKNIDTVDVDITSNGEYVFTVSDMCENTVTEKVVVSKIIKPSLPPAAQDTGDDRTPPSDNDRKDKDNKNEGSEGGNKTVVIGKSSGTSPQNTTKDSTITVKNAASPTVSEGGSVKITASTNRYLGGMKQDGETEGEVSENLAEEEEEEYEPAPEDFSSEFYDTELPEYNTSNEPKELEALPNPDEVEEVEERSNAGVIAGTVFAIVLGLSALTVFLLIKKGIIKKPDFLGGSGEEQ